LQLTAYAVWRRERAKNDQTVAAPSHEPEHGRRAMQHRGGCTALSRACPTVRQWTRWRSVDHIATGCGVAAPRGASLDQCAHRLIAIAHPDRRDELQFNWPYCAVRVARSYSAVGLGL
jgi:Acetyl-CoA hydrolase/transferase C-terminal domain